MYPPLNQLNVRPVGSLSNENWLGILKRPLSERPEFSVANGTINIGQVLGNFLGIPIDTDDYYNQLFDYVNKKEWNLQLLSEESLDKSINNAHFQSIQKVLTINHDEKLSINRFTAFLDGEQLLLKSQVPSIHRKLREAMISTLELYKNSESDGLKNNELRRVLVDLVKWSINHLQPVLEKADPQKEMPKYLWYGDFKKSHQYFIYYLIKLGCDIVIFHPEGKNILAGIVDNQVFTHKYQNILPPEVFPKEKRTRKTNVS
ncbi:MAG: YceG family protein, partial [Bacillus sp. (in: Bacteria)]|nr:YceG family protein [Bacillus sp. (in: firmicutes)]